MNIFWLSHLVPYPPTGFGVLQRSYNLLRETAKYHNVYLLALVQRDLLRTVFADEEEAKRRAHEELSRLCAKVKFIPIPCEKVAFGKYRVAIKSLFTRSPYTVNWLKSAEMHEAIEEWKSAYQFDVVHFDIISLAPYVGAFPEHKKTLDHHNIESHMMLRRVDKTRNLLKKWYFLQEGVKLQIYEKRECPRFDVHLTCSHLDTTRLRELVPSLRIEEVPNGVDLDYFNPRSDQESTGLIFVGNLGWYPNAAAMSFFAEQVWPLLKSDIPDITIDVVGGKPPGSLVSLSKKDPAFRVHGFVRDVRPYMERAAIYVCPIMDGGGTKLKILDALAMAKPIICHPIACEGIDVKPGVHVLFATSPAEYVSHIRALLGDRDARRDLGSQGRRLVSEEYSYLTIGKKLRRIFDECAARANRNRANAGL
jgi:glycosyltransferase involved in cell wall biosynthesis